MRQLTRRGFTLLELLVVLAIIAVLLGILLPALSRARELGKRAVCLSNIRQLTAAWLSYAYENHGRFPTADIMPIGSYNASDANGNKIRDMSAWLSPKADFGGIDWRAGRLWPYLQNQQVYWCPDDSRDRNPHYVPFNSPCVSYVMNGFLGELAIVDNNVTQVLGVKMTMLSQIRHPVDMFVFTEASPDVIWPSFFWPPVYSPINRGPMSNAGFIRDISWPAYFHCNRSRAEGCMMSFADGHAIFWQYIPDKDVYMRATSSDIHADLTPFSGADRYQLETWSGGPFPPGTAQ